MHDACLEEKSFSDSCFVSFIAFSATAQARFSIEISQNEYYSIQA